jgi:photosystem II stability/assembly factor-like uncharacterized protein
VLRNRRVVMERTADQGRHWSTVGTLELVATGPPSIVAPDASHAWLLVPAVAGVRVYVTADAGKSWRRIDQNFTR